MDPLVEIPREKWPVLRDLYLASWPDGAPAFCLLDIQITRPGLQRPFQFKVYCPYGEMTNGMVATTFRDNYIYQVLIHPINDNTDKIEEALLETKIINWDFKKVVIPSANAATIACLERVRDKLGLKIDIETKSDKHLLDMTSNMYEDVNLPPDTYIGTLRSEDIDLVDKSWPYHGKLTKHLFELFTQNNLSYALYAKKETKELHGQPVSNEPLAWLSVNEHGALAHLFTAENHRNKGYASLITKYIANKMLSKKGCVIAYTTDVNIRSKTLFRKLGFKDVGRDYWLAITKHK